MNSRTQALARTALAVTLAVFSTGCATTPQTAGLGPGNLPPLPTGLLGQTPLAGVPLGSNTGVVGPGVTGGDPLGTVTGPADGGAALFDSTNCELTDNDCVASQGPAYYPPPGTCEETDNDCVASQGPAYVPGLQDTGPHEAQYILDLRASVAAAQADVDRARTALAAANQDMAQAEEDVNVDAFFEAERRRATEEGILREASLRLQRETEALNDALRAAGVT